jgi:hypothetical protein
MSYSSYYLEQADHARRLAEATVQHNVAELLLLVARELDDLADHPDGGAADLRDSERVS